MGVGVGGAAWYGCSVYDASLLLPAPDSGPLQDAFAPDTGRVSLDAGVEAAAPNPCPEAFVPPAPAADDPSDAGDQSFVVAVHTIDVGLNEAGTGVGNVTFGYDLDQVYTCCDGGAESCKAAITGATHCDDVSGRDNSGAHLLGALAGASQGLFSPSSISQRLQSGEYSILLQVLHYNGTPNDTQVTVALYASAGVESDAGAQWNGNDQWTVEDSFVASEDAEPLIPTRFDPVAYVADGTLVLHINFPIELGTSTTASFDINLTAGVGTAQVVPQSGGTFALAGGVIAGRWNNAQLLASLDTLSFNGTPLCPGNGGIYPLIKGQVCQYSDIMTDPTLDRMGSTCDAVSLAIGFTADPAQIGNIVPTPAKTSLCPDAGPDNCSTQ